MNRFEAEALDCRRGGRQVFKGLSFALSSGDALILTGPNGSGKSSLLRILAGLLPAAGGGLRWNDRPLAEDPDAHRGRLCYLGHLDAVKPALSVAENLAFWAGAGSGGANAGANAGSREAIGRALETVALTHLIDLPARFLSAGQKRRVNLARLALGPTDLWLLDEPATALDVETTGRLVETIDSHRLAGGMVVLSTHADLGLGTARNLDLGDYQAGTAAGAAGTAAA